MESVSQQIRKSWQPYSQISSGISRMSSGNEGMPATTLKPWNRLSEGKRCRFKRTWSTKKSSSKTSITTLKRIWGCKKCRKRGKQRLIRKWSRVLMSKLVRKCRLKHSSSWKWNNQWRHQWVLKKPRKLLTLNNKSNSWNKKSWSKSYSSKLKSSKSLETLRFSMKDYRTPNNLSKSKLSMNFRSNSKKEKNNS